MKKTLALLLALCMVFSLLAACGSSASSAAPAASAASAEAETSAPEAEEPEVEEPEAPAEPESAEEASVLDGSSEVVETKGDPMEAMAEEYISYPLEGDNTITMWYYAPPYVQFVDSNMKFNAIDDMEAATGVKLDIKEVGSSTAGEQFNLMVASGDMTDLIPAREYYTGGITKAYEEDIIIDISEYIDENMPNYVDVLACLDEQTQKDTLNDGMMLAFSTINDGTYSGDGMITRGDWLEDLGIEFSGNLISLDEFTDMITKMHDKYGCANTIYMTDGTIPVEAAFDTEIPVLKGDGFMTFIDSAIFRKGDEVMSGWVTDGYRDYIEWALGLMDQGIISKNFLELDADRGVMNTAQGSGDVAVWTANADKMEEILWYTDDPNFKVAAVPNITADPSEPYVWKQSQSLVSNQGGMSISTSCEQPELVCQWMNYFWTTDGYYMANYGVEGESLVWEGDQPRFDWETPTTVTGMNAPNAEMALELFTAKRFVTFYADNDRLLPTFPESALAAVELWTLDATDERYYPTTVKANFTTEQNEEIAKYEGDFLTYAAETCLEFMTGA
ncbi:MAG: extracellular solute-binding protein, partial [Oscillospiraceae bacterium]|nr:extracellular solute-binding protein [Oscillospiraceae bacterium]